jgi:hypothetical protein
MLPGFRFLFVAMVLTISVVVFGLGAAALLRAAHDEFAGKPSWRTAPETLFTQPAEATSPVLTMLRADPLGAEPKAPDNGHADAAPAEQAAIISTAADPQKIAALKSEDSSSPGTAKPAMPVSESPAQSEAAPAKAETTASDDDSASLDQTKTAALEQLSSAVQALSRPNEPAPAASEPVSAAPEQANAPASSAPDAASTKIATLGGAIETQPPAKAASAKTANAKPDRSAIKKRLQARRAAERRKIALLRARLPPQPPKRPANPFAPFVQPAAPARSR